uniref:Uncharacterized protein n=1 Tax=Chromera velia CCMP2878 TaxID=1169474 RepID=A0A0G4HN36_9ALVE|eukprot:Cvel_29359.t1-p1 / transcript=Cvel_29359.t1 / gene=Cvel_29359 / organism=Chromera_velia_CCMP2878 / gene_product=hypothetical protein / transcript_product=hypothetical protein / location=Cvel_scaffold3998:3979-5499(-) / protein_length=507 / sequence_SO=supercontig / SO=protein_coding / is_pseudo=false
MLRQVLSPHSARHFAGLLPSPQYGIFSARIRELGLAVKSVRAGRQMKFHPNSVQQFFAADVQVRSFGAATPNACQLPTERLTSCMEGQVESQSPQRTENLEELAMKILTENTMPSESFAGLEVRKTRFQPTADFGVRPRGLACRDPSSEGQRWTKKRDAWLGVQLKCSTQREVAGGIYFGSGARAGKFRPDETYAGMPVLCNFLKSATDPSTWLWGITDGKKIRKRRQFYVHKRDLEEGFLRLRHQLLELYDKGVGLGQDAAFPLVPFSVLETPDSQAHKIERMSRLRWDFLLEKVPGPKITWSPTYSHISACDEEWRVPFSSQKLKIQFKTASWGSKTNRPGSALVPIRRMLGRKHVLYSENDWDFVAVAPPFNAKRNDSYPDPQNIVKTTTTGPPHVSFFYLVPMGVFRKHFPNGPMTHTAHFGDIPGSESTPRTMQVFAEFRLDLRDPEGGSRLLEILRKGRDYEGRPSPEMPRKNEVRRNTRFLLSLPLGVPSSVTQSHMQCI